MSLNEIRDRYESINKRIFSSALINLLETEYKIQQALENIMKNTTTFIITQRISTIRNADIIILLDKGRITGLGNHSTLIENNALENSTLVVNIFALWSFGDT